MGADLVQVRGGLIGGEAYMLVDLFLCPPYGSVAGPSSAPTPRREGDGRWEVGGREGRWGGRYNPQPGSIEQQDKVK